MMRTALRGLLRAGIYLVFLFVLWQMGIPLLVGWIIPALLLAIHYSCADSIAVFTLGAHRVDEYEASTLHDLIDHLATHGKYPKPRVFLIHDTECDAFVIGRAGHPRMIAVTTGLLCRCTRQQLEEALTHESSHPSSFRMGVVVVGMIFSLFTAAIVLAFV
jgi:heat shock protein HtpX